MENEDFEALKKRIGEASGTEWIAVMIDASSDKGIYSIEEIYVIAEQYFFWGQDEFMDERFWKMITKATNVKNKNEFFEKYKRVFDETKMDATKLNLAKAAFSELKREAMLYAQSIDKNSAEFKFEA
ncbi:hypothetical protein NO989_18700 [Alteromonas sp. DY56-G5]|jgi:hypothetical protein|uniref:Uncharacterized protein n=1 Tax=Alteromonas macleodii TaxID=28108 RepID=A0AB36FLJ8_ALTMA|nr:hypothetical protein [Alteromonas macleodii]AUI84839.1 hypothetical protein TE101_20995 [Alteromonas macleodii]OES23730.1 hypothetical protein BFV93_4921 [Alteromonas macleodii]OES23943.1 hypothetical protein BFV94_4893 [Alteromonas macleodii]OES25643.1 hypothetical protein BFV95_4325 [Alteromonas macleodii]OES38945.1 hypothetical protein BFV96_4543 [Alteromonas macleodii]|tara:strand:+ start:60 stop:440 length:381 start_codon:yes stop_codon:yes gene_type:complete